MVMKVKMIFGTINQTEHVRVHEPGHKVCWGINSKSEEWQEGERCQWIETLEGNRTRYITEDYIGGKLTPAVKAIFGSSVSKGFDGVAAGLKVQAES